MSLVFHKNGDNFVQAEAVDLSAGKEKEIQELFETNLEQLTGYQFVCSEFQIKNKRIDTIAFDTETGSFVIIEYKRDKNSGLFDQGLAYLSLILQHKNDVFRKYQEIDNSLNENDVDWSQTRVVFVSPVFSDTQIEAVNFKDLPIELLRIKKFENEIVIVEEIEKSEDAENFADLLKNIKVISEEKHYTEEYHLEGKSQEIRNLYYKFRDRIRSLDESIKVEAVKGWVSYFLSSRRKDKFVGISFSKTGLNFSLHIKRGTLDDPQNLAEESPEDAHYGKCSYLVKNVNDEQNFEYIISLIQQALNEAKEKLATN